MSTIPTIQGRGTNRPLVTLKQPVTQRTLALVLASTMLAAPVSARAQSAGAVPLRGQHISREYQAKAVFLYNFAKFVEWPAGTLPGPLTICIAGRNPLGTFLDETIQGETVGGRPIVTRIILEPEAGCHVMFVPDGAAATAYLRATRNTPTLTVGETPRFLGLGGIISFFVDNGKVRFEINPKAAEQSQLRISSRLLQLARIQNAPGELR